MNPGNRLTYSSLFHFLRRDGKERDHFDHDVHHYAPHGRSRRDTRVYFHSFEVVFDPAEDAEERFSASVDVLCGLGDLSVTICHRTEIKKNTDRQENPDS